MISFLFICVIFPPLLQPNMMKFTKDVCHENGTEWLKYVLSFEHTKNEWSKRDLVEWIICILSRDARPELQWALFHEFCSLKHTLLSIPCTRIVGHIWFVNKIHVHHLFFSKGSINPWIIPHVWRNEKFMLHVIQAHWLRNLKYFLGILGMWKYMFSKKIPIMN